jgi:plastocyanin
LIAVVANGIASAPVSVMVPVRVLDSGFSPTAAQTVIGGAMTWVVPASDTTSHTIRDGSGLGLFNSETRTPGGSFSFTFPAAGTYVVSDQTNRKSSTVGLRVSATPTSGTSATSFTVRWANRALPAGYVEDVSIERPGRSSFAPWRTGRTGTSVSFLPDAGQGTYKFVSRIRRTANGHKSLSSPAVTITVH